MAEAVNNPAEAPDTLPSPSSPPAPAVSAVSVSDWEINLQVVLIALAGIHSFVCMLQLAGGLR
jgi:hypothetical protein